MPRPEYDKEKVLQWYASLGETLKEANIDINNPKDLARVKVYYFNELKDTKAPGDPTMYDDDKMSAFVPKKFDKNKEMSGYKVPKPKMPSREDQDELDSLLKDNLNANSAQVNGVALLRIAYESKNKNRIEEAKNNLAQYEADVISTFDAFRKKGNDAFKDYYQWMYSNQKKFNPEEDYDQIEELYHSAMEGRLYINPLDSNPENRWQLVVTGSGNTSDFSKVGAQEKVDAFDTFSILSAIDTIKKQATPSPALRSLCETISPLLNNFEQEHGVIGDANSASTKEIGNPPQEVAKPGVGSWLKRIFSLGIANGDFKKYETYQNELRTYNAQKDEVREYNQNMYKKALLFANTYHKELGIAGLENVVNPGTVEDSRIRMHNAEFVMGVERPDKEIYNDSINTVMIRHAQITEHEVANNPEIINLDGSHNTQKSNEYWNVKKELVLPTIQHDRDKAYSGFDEAKTEYEKHVANQRDKKELDEMVKSSIDNAINNELADRQQETLLKKSAQQKIEEKNETIDFSETKLLLKGMSKAEAEDVMKTWTSASVDARIKQIGSLFGASPKDAWNVGVNMFATCVTRNQEYNQDGSERDYSMLKTDRPILEDLNKLLDIAEHPEKAAENQKFLDDLKQLRDKTEITAPMLVDSAASILATHEAFTGAKEAKDLGLGLFTCAQISYRYSRSEKNPQGVNLEEDYKVAGEKNRTLSDQDQRQRLYDLGKECYQIGQIVNESKKAVKERDNIKAELKKGTYGVGAPDLNLKRDQNLDLAKEPGLYH